MLARFEFHGGPDAAAVTVTASTYAQSDRGAARIRSRSVRISNGCSADRRTGRDGPNRTFRSKSQETRTMTKATIESLLGRAVTISVLYKRMGP
jgi:hypothetical protein